MKQQSVMNRLRYFIFQHERTEMTGTKWSSQDIERAAEIVLQTMSLKGSKEGMVRGGGNTYLRRMPRNILSFELSL